MAIVILRLQDGLNYSDILEDGEKSFDLNAAKEATPLSKSMMTQRDSSESLTQNQSYAQMSQGI